MLGIRKSLNILPQKKAEEFTMKKIIFGLAIALMCANVPAFAADKLNINTATQEELAACPAIGPELAAKITEYLQDVGDFTSYDDLKDIEGVDDSKIKDITQYFVIEGVESFDCNC